MICLHELMLLSSPVMLFCMKCLNELLFFSHGILKECIAIIYRVKQCKKCSYFSEWLDPEPEGTTFPKNIFIFLRDNIV